MKDSDSQIAFHKLSTLTEEDIQAVQERVRLRVLKSFKRSGFEKHDVENMKAWNDGAAFRLMVRHAFMKMIGKYGRNGFPSLRFLFSDRLLVLITRI